uniref:phage major capsid protein n=1 Tax=Ornithobacterium rhinotracheale TaxID=28251 RepID=UPI0039A4D033
MAKNFPEIWENRVRHNLEQGGQADFLEGVSELDGDVTQMGEKNLIHIPTSQFNPEVLINNTSYPLAVQEYDDDEVVISLDKYQTKPTKVTDDQVIGASYDRIDTVTKSHTNSINARKFKKALHALAPQKDEKAKANIVLDLAGDKCTYEDLVALKDKCDEAGWPEEGRRLVLCNKHWNALLLDRKNFGDQLVNYKQGEVAPVIAGFEIKKYVASPHYGSNKEKKAFEEVAQSGDKPASVAFVLDNTAKKTGITKQYFSEAGKDPENQANLLGYRHYFIATPVEDKWRAALI